MPTEEPATTEEVAKLLAARNAEEFLVGVRPHLRRLVQAVDEELVDVFDSSFGSEATALVEKLRNRHSDGPPHIEGDFQGAGFRQAAIENIVAFAIGFAASIAASIVVDTTKSMLNKSTMTIGDLPAEQRERTLAYLENDPVLRHLPLKPINV